MICHLEMCLTSARRALGDSALSVKAHVDGKVVLMSKREPYNPNTAGQRGSREATSRLAGAWRGLDAPQRAEWSLAAERLRGEFPRQQGRLTGYMLFSQCARNCQIAGAEPPESAPGGYLRPLQPERVELLPSDDPSTFAFRIHHQIRGSSYRVLVYLTPGTLRGSRRPRECDRVLICGHGAESAPPLPESGGAVVFTGARHAVEPGKRFGVWIRVVHLPSGVASEELYLDLTRTSDGNPPRAEESRQDDDATSSSSVDSSRPSASASTSPSPIQTKWRLLSPQRCRDGIGLGRLGGLACAAGIPRATSGPLCSQSTSLAPIRGLEEAAGGHYLARRATVRGK